MKKVDKSYRRVLLALHNFPEIALNLSRNQGNSKSYLGDISPVRQ